MRVRPGIELASLSDVGCQRANNEDRYSYWEPAEDEHFPAKGRLAIVADGMGGYEGGQEASRIAVEVIEEVYATSVAGDPRSWLLAGFQTAHSRIQDYAAKYPDLHGMGTTCTAIALLDHELYYAHVGDSRLYLVRDSSISRLTHDHSYVTRLVDNGIIRADEAETHPQRHILTAALGAGNSVAPDSPAVAVALQSGDVLVLCTDGMWGLLSDHDILKIVEGKSVDNISRALVETAKERGGPDNITVQVLRLGV
jgi:serine/threonine protein phosphatase PrpC